MEETKYCTFCNKTEHEVEYLFQNENSIAICDKCIKVFSGIMEKNKECNCESCTEEDCCKKE